MKAYICPYARLDDGTWTCDARQEAEEQKRMDMLLGKPSFIFANYCPSDVKKNDRGERICWQVDTRR